MNDMLQVVERVRGKPRRENIERMRAGTDVHRNEISIGLVPVYGSSRSS